MTPILNQKYLSLNESIAKEANKLSRSFNNKSYSKIEDINKILLKRDISVEKKKSILIKKLHQAVVGAFSIDKNRFNKKAFDSLKKRMHDIRRIIIKLRSINYYLETTFLENLKLSKIKIRSQDSKLKEQSNLARDDLEALEYTTYKLIGEVIMLDKRLLSEYASKGEKILVKEKIEVRDIDLVLRKESGILEHLEAKLPPPRVASYILVKEPTFTHWVARVFALLSYLEHIYIKEIMIFNKLKKNKAAKIKINKKIIHLMKEKSKLLKIMEEKATSMRTSKNQGFLVPRKSRGFSREFKIDKELKRELHNLTTIIAL